MCLREREVCVCVCVCVCFRKLNLFFHDKLKSFLLSIVSLAVLACRYVSSLDVSNYVCPGFLARMVYLDYKSL